MRKTGGFGAVAEAPEVVAIVGAFGALAATP
jgi:hypothetical protein